MNWTTALHGAALWLTLPDAAPEDAMRRMLFCAACPSRRDFTEDELWKESKVVGAIFRKAPRTAWCGRPGVAVEGNSCGCLVGREASAGESTVLTIKGRPMVPDGKMAKAGAACPRGNF